VAVWNISHNLGFVPNITVVDSSGEVVEGSYEYPNATTVRLTFDGAFSGKAYLS
jgi:predicted phage tail protein